jgi:CheY-like chemotaxis protein
VADTGCGIADELKHKVFDRFFRASPSYEGHHLGHGVGLHIAESYVTLLGGTISLESTLNVGTTFTIDLALKVDESSIDTAFKPTPSEHTVQHSIAPLDVKIARDNQSEKPLWLLIEDNATALLMLSHMVEQMGTAYITATTAEDGLRLAKQHAIHLIITDLGLPQMSGIGFTISWRQFELEQKLPPIPIIGLTAHADIQIKQECIDAGMNEAYTKPMTLSVLKTIQEKFGTIQNKLTMNNYSVSPPSSISPVSALPMSANGLGVDLPNTEAELFELNHKPLLDPQVALKELDNNATLFNKILIQMVEHDLPHDLDELHAAYKIKDWDAIEHTAHRMKGGFVYCGMLRLSLACQYLERYRKTGQTSQLDLLFKQVITVSNNSITTINRWLRLQE